MIIKPPTSLKKFGRDFFSRSVFLAGSIEMGKAEDWQNSVGEILIANGWNVFSPRRDDWDSTWEQSINNPQFRAQVEWELHALEECQAVLFYFQPYTLSPISLLEFGMHAPWFKRTALVCPEGYWRKGNVDVVADRYGIEQQATLCEAIKYLGYPVDG